MRYEAEIEGEHAVIELDERDGKVEASINDRRYQVTVQRPEPGVVLLMSGDRVYEARVWRGQGQPAEPGTFSVELKGRVVPVKLIDRKHRRTGEPVESGQQYLTAPMPGKVVRLLLTVGDRVNAGQGVLVVEAMKMQNEIKSRNAGVISELRVKEGDAVTANQVLAVVQ
jgi:biotin carboxyl carrier protein